MANAMINNEFHHLNCFILIASYNCGDFIVYRESSNKIGRILTIVEVDGELKVIIQHVLKFIELLENLQSNTRKERCANEV